MSSRLLSTLQAIAPSLPVLMNWRPSSANLDWSAATKLKPQRPLTADAPRQRQCFVLLLVSVVGGIYVRLESVGGLTMCFVVDSDSMNWC